MKPRKQVEVKSVAELRLVIETKTSTFPGSGEGYGSIVDRDVVFDDLGLPYLPARRIKGVLYESALELKEMLGNAKLKDLNERQLIDIFGKEGEIDGSALMITDLYLSGYEDISEWLKYLFYQYSGIFSPHSVLDSFTEIRHQTSISTTGVAEEGSLRTSRVLRKGLQFEGRIVLSGQEDVELLALACANLRHLGGQRNRGFGEVLVELYDGEKNLTGEALKNLSAGGAEHYG